MRGVNVYGFRRVVIKWSYFNKGCLVMSGIRAFEYFLEAIGSDFKRVDPKDDALDDALDEICDMATD